MTTLSEVSEHIGVSRILTDDEVGEVCTKSVLYGVLFRQPFPDKLPTSKLHELEGHIPITAKRFGAVGLVSLCQGGEALHRKWKDLAISTRYITNPAARLMATKLIFEARQHITGGTYQKKKRLSGRARLLQAAP